MIVLLLLWIVFSLALLAQQPRIGVAGISHESNSFNPAKTTLADFGWPPKIDRERWAADVAKSRSTVSGYVEGAKRFGLDLYPTVVVGASPKGPVTADAFETMSRELVRQLKEAPKLDGVLLALHGAMVAESFPHGDAELVRRVREAMGPNMPIIVTHDFHANVAPEIVKESTALITFKENPHIDTFDRGIQAARIMADTVRGKVKPTQALAKPAMIYNIVFQYTKRPPLLPIVEESRKLEKNPKVLAASVSGGYQYADVPQVGPSVIVVTDNDPALAQREAQRLSDLLWQTRDKLTLNLPDAAQAVKMAMESDKHPVVLIDMGDNIGGGSAGDSTFLLAELLRQKAQGWVVVIADAQAYKVAAEAGVGAPFDFQVGGKTDTFHGDPVHVRGRVKSLHLGHYIETEIRHGGGRYHDRGLTAVIEVEGSTREMENLLVLTTRRSSPNSLHQIISCGIYPERQKILTVKGAIAPRAAYEPIAGRIIEADTAGLTAVNPARFTYRLVRRPLFGLDQ
jgi:microcystin degradation protein MlrC